MMFTRKDLIMYVLLILVLVMLWFDTQSYTRAAEACKVMTELRENGSFISPRIG